MDWEEEYRDALLNTTKNPPNIREIVKPRIPSKLYKYGSFQNNFWRETMFKGKIHLSPAKIFNDPFDCRARFNYKKAITEGNFRDRLLLYYPKNEIENLTEDIVQKHVVEGMREDVYVFCFSEVWNSLLMWAHYANNYNGYCIEYDMKQVRDMITYDLFPVLYEKEYIDITDRLISINTNTGLVCNLVKAEDWKYEREWRIVKYKKNPFYLRQALKAVYLGKNCIQKDKEDVIQWAKENNKEIYSIEISKTQYELEAHKII